MSTHNEFIEYRKATAPRIKKRETAVEKGGNRGIFYYRTDTDEKGWSFLNLLQPTRKRELN